MARDKTEAAIIVVSSLMLGVILFSLALVAVQANGLSGRSLIRLADYSAAASVIFILGMAIGCWRGVGWVFLIGAVFNIIIHAPRFASFRFWESIGNASAVAILIVSLACGIALGRFVRARLSRRRHHDD